MPNNPNWATGWEMVIQFMEISRLSSRLGSPLIFTSISQPRALHPASSSSAAAACGECGEPGERCEVNHGARRSHMIHLRFTILPPTLRSCLQSIRSGLGARQHFLSATTVIDRYPSSMSRKTCRCGHKVHVFPQLLSLQVTSVSSSADIKRADRLAQTWVWNQ